MRKEGLSANEAHFKVPLRFNKFDMRDYLWNVYNVEVTRVRSMVKALPLQRKPNQQNSTYRPLPEKRMIVQLAKPFPWPQLPQDLEPWNKTLYMQRDEHMDQHYEESSQLQQGKIPLKSMKPATEERKKLASLAEKMLSGEVEWKNDVVLDPKWDTLQRKQKAPQSNTEER